MATRGRSATSRRRNSSVTCQKRPKYLEKELITGTSCLAGKQTYMHRVSGWLSNGRVPDEQNRALEK
ncbi:hypothetical protein JTE90_006110 [Oedothorax gibbosus]|uniref:Uncharacterized protein n=1 Tax=Oedothorax gibbosus TaxID=931172 RepID=A0AAV6V6V2_9ARAC|nr:hypothetical protein JTE90_006110 [Oedothorax gibbosus]